MIRNFLSVFKPKNLIWHALAISLAALLVLSDTDWRFFVVTRPYLYHWLVYGAGLGGFVVTLCVPLSIYLVGEFKKNGYLMQLGAAVGQAAVLGYLVSILYKVFTGRTQPDFLFNGGIDISKQFHFGILQNGIFWGWPSSHAATAFAGAITLFLLVRSHLARTLAVLYALFIATGAAIGFHWLSDVLAGAIFGTLVATIVAKDFKTR